MKSTKKILLALSMIAAVGVVGVAPRAEAVTVAPPSVCLGAGVTESIAFIVGEDGRVWYTRTTNSAGPAFVTLGKGLAGNPFFGAVPNALTSPLAGFVNPATFPSGAGNFGIWVPVPGGVTFRQTTPTCVKGAGAVTDHVVILVAGLDNRVWHTVFSGATAAAPVFSAAEVLTSGAGLAGSSAVWTTATDAPGTVDGWASTIVGGAGPIIPWVPFP